MTPSTVSFPVPLVCPACGTRLTSPSCDCAAGTRFENEAGIPRLLFGQKYCGETSSANMVRILDLTKRVHWSEALGAVAPAEGITAHLNAEMRADFVHAMPWNEIRNVLDVGAGMGFLTFDLARYADSVVALEAIPERARFIQARARQDGLAVHPVVASAMAMPFEPETFDLITLNGTFEYIGLWGTGDPKMLQQRFLESALRLLKPNGFLYVGTETRFATAKILGGRDHTGPMFASVMPRRMADWYCRLRKSSFDCSTPTLRGYRTYTHTPRQYRAMFERAGFRRVDVFGVFDRYDRQRVVYNLDHFIPRKIMLARVNPPTSPTGRLRRACTDNRLLYKTLESDVVIFARKGSAATPGMGDSLSRGEGVVQVSTQTKVLTFRFENGRPITVAERVKPGAPVMSLITSAYGVVRTAQSLYGAEVASWPMRWPKPGATVSTAHHTAYEYEYADGYSVAAQLLPASYQASQIVPVIERVIAGYPELCVRLAVRWPKGNLGDYWQELAEVVESKAAEPELQRRLRQGVVFARARGWALGVTHGDLSASNVIVGAAGQLVLIDWDRFCDGIVAVDLIRFCYDICVESNRLQPRKHAALVAKVRLALVHQLQIMGFTEEDFEALEALFIAHQIHCAQSMPGAEPLIEMYLTKPLLGAR